VHSGHGLSLVIGFVHRLVSGHAIDLRERLSPDASWDGDARRLALDLNTLLERIAPDLRELEAAVNTASTIGRSSELLLSVADDSAAQATRADQILVAVRESASGAENVSELSRRSHEIAATLAETSERSITTMHHTLDRLIVARDESVALGQTVAALEARVGEIAALSKSIGSIAELTNLLSLNAAIEAARAGQHGRGFAVVASEVRKLADRAADAAKQITSAVSDVRDATLLTKKGVEGSANAASGAATDGETIRVALERMVALIDEANSAVGSIAAVAEEQSSALAQITDAADDAKRSAAGVAERAAKLRTLGTGDLNLVAGRVFARYRTGSLTDRIYDVAAAGADDVERELEIVFARLRDRGLDLFATDYREMTGSAIARLAPLCDVSRAPASGFHPPKYYTSWDAETDAVLAPIVDRCGDADESIVLACVVDLNGYLTMNRRDARQAITGDPERDLKGNRIKRFFEETVPLRGARCLLDADRVPKRASRADFARAGVVLDSGKPEQRPFIVQSYARDTGEVHTDLAVPLFVNNRRWGALRIAYRAATR
jgi:methyl-accepting chemotaxis protein